MVFPKVIIILVLLCWGFDLKAQEPQGPQEAPSSMPEQWQLTLDVIKSKAQTLLIENNGLQSEYQELSGQLQRLQRSMEGQQFRNEQMGRFIRERHGRTDQQLMIEELKQKITAKKEEAGPLDEQRKKLQRKQLRSGRKIQLLNGNGKEPTAQEPPVDDQLDPLRRQLENDNKQEVLLANELEALKTGGQKQHLNLDDILDYNKQLEAHLEVLRLQEFQHKKEFSNQEPARVRGQMYDKLKNRKDELEININEYEQRLDSLREASLLTMSWPLKKKKLVHAMVQADARNNQLLGRIKVMREDIDVLKDQINKLERRAGLMHVGPGPG